MIERYRSRISGPLLDRIDLHVPVPALNYRELSENASSESSADIRERVAAARGRQAVRFGTADSGLGMTNAQMPQGRIKQHGPVCVEGARLLETAVTRLGLSARGYSRVLKVARTIADLDESGMIRPQDLAEAIQYRSLDRTQF